MKIGDLDVDIIYDINMNHVKDDNSIENMFNDWLSLIKKEKIKKLRKSRIKKINKINAKNK